MNLPAISVIIPLYNAEKYIGECLESILAQTFQDFEVIVVDDCSTDSSAAIVKSYESKFGECLTLTATKKNSASPAAPCNLGIAFSRGDYLFFLDNDDTITPTALEELYSVAKDFDADVVACEKYYCILEKFWYDADCRKNLEPESYKRGDFVTSPTLLTDNLSERAEDYMQQKFLWPAWTKLIKRKFIVENKIRFEQSIVSDFIFTSCLIFSAKKWVRVPNTINYWRLREESLSNRKKNLGKYFSTYSRALTAGFNYLDNFFADIEFFQQNPGAKYAVSRTYVEHILHLYFSKIYSLISHEDVYENLAALDELLRKDFADGKNVALMTFIFNMLNVYRTELLRAKKHIGDLEKIARQDKAYISELENFLKSMR